VYSVSVLKHVGVLSVAKITALFGVIFGLIYGILFSVFAAAFVSLMPGVSGLGPLAAGGIGIVLVILTAIVGAIGGFIYGAVVAFLYNVFAGWIGGVEIDLA
jgi:hypothetical protein